MQRLQKIAAWGCSVPAAAIFLLLLMCSGCTSGGDRHIAPVNNFGEVSPEVWRGGKPNKEGMQWLAQRGVKTIIDLQMEDESSDVPRGVGYVPIRVSMFHCDCVDVAAVIKAIDQSPKPVFVHCQAGRDRTGLAVAAWRMAHGMSADDAIAEMEQYGKHAWWSAAIKSRIRRLQEQYSSKTLAEAAQTAKSP